MRVLILDGGLWKSLTLRMVNVDNFYPLEATTLLSVQHSRRDILAYVERTWLKHSVYVGDYVFTNSMLYRRPLEDEVSLLSIIANPSIKENLKLLRSLGIQIRPSYLYIERNGRLTKHYKAEYINTPYLQQIEDHVRQQINNSKSRPSAYYAHSRIFKGYEPSSRRYRIAEPVAYILTHTNSAEYDQYTSTLTISTDSANCVTIYKNTYSTMREDHAYTP